VTYDVNAGSSYRTTAAHVTLAYPGPMGTACGTGFVSGCSIAISSTNPAVKTYNAKVNHSGDTWILINNSPGSITGLPLSNGLSLSVNPAVADTLATGAYSGQVMVYNPANQGDVLMVNVSLLVNPGNIAVSPSSGAGSSETFTMQFPHPGGWQKLSVVSMLIGGSLEPEHACFVAYELATSSLLLVDDQAQGGYAPGANSQCGVRLVSAKGDGNLLTLAVNVSFRAGFSGKKNIYLSARDNAQNNSGWLALGTWEVRPPAAAPPKKKKK
jgi:hypothetical protein